MGTIHIKKREVAPDKASKDKLPVPEILCFFSCVLVLGWWIPANCLAAITSCFNCCLIFFIANRELYRAKEFSETKLIRAVSNWKVENGGSPSFHFQKEMNYRDWSMQNPCWKCNVESYECLKLKIRSLVVEHLAFGQLTTRTPWRLPSSSCPLILLHPLTLWVLLSFPICFLILLLTFSS